MSVQATTQIITLLGYPVAHSFSPLLHNFAFQKQKLDYIYIATPVKPSALNEAIAGIRALQFAGANVTLPHKSTVIPYLDELTPQARQTGAVNTIVCSYREGKTHLKGDNTDIEGFLHPLLPYHQYLNHSRVVLFGSGGAARAAIYALNQQFTPEKIFVIARNPEKARQLQVDFDTQMPSDTLQIVPFSADISSLIQEAQLLVNTTPVGMWPHTETMIWPHAKDFHAGHIVYDMVYNPPITRWLQQAQQAGATILSGLDMFIGQAAASFRLWTGKEMPLKEVKDYLTHTLHQPIP